MISDTRLHQNVLDELEWDASVDAAKIGVTVNEGIVTLSGTVPRYSDRSEAERVVKKLQGVKGVANDIEVHLPGIFQRNDTDIAQAAVSALKWHVSVPEDHIRVIVHNGFLTLEGNVDWQYQREAAYNAVRFLTGVKSVSNQLQISPKVSPAEVSAKIEAAFKRSAELDAKKVRVEACGCEVSLKGKVANFLERDEAEQAAWSAPGVSTVSNYLTVGT